MKRAAEHQLTRDSTEDEGDELGEGSFRRASEADLAGRKIRALPKRNGSVISESASKPPSLGTFSGFGGSSTIAASASNTAKTFASFLDTSPSSNGTEPDEVKYYSSLRGLNVSFGASMAKALESDPFTDISSLLETYRGYRQNIQKEYDQKAPAKSAPSQETAKESAPDSSALKMPAPPSTFKGFGTVTSSSTSSSPGTGFIPTTTITSSSSPFSFPSASNSPSKPSPFSFKPSTEPALPSTSLLGSSSTPSTSSSPSIPSLFGDSSSVSAPKNPFSMTSSFGSSSAFGATSTSKPEASAFSFSSIKPESNPFGGSTLSAPKIDSTPTTSTPSTPSTSVFGKSGSTFGGFGGFGKPSSTLGGSVGWGFGSSSTSAAKSDESNNTESQDSRASSIAGESQEEGQDSGEPKADAATMFATSSAHDEEGAGEEDEETTHSIKLKVYKLKKNPPEGTSPWADMGAGVLRLKRNKTDDTRRMLLRNSNTGKININFNIYGGENPKLTKNAIVFTGRDEGKPQAYTVRTKTEQQAQELKAAMDREIAFVKAKQAD